MIAVLAIILGSSRSLILLLILELALGLVLIHRLWAASAFTLSSIPAAWYAGTAYAVSLMGVPPKITLVDAVLIYLRVLSYSVTILFIAYMISPVKLLNLLRRARFPAGGLLVMMTWRMMPLGLRFMMESVMIGSLKGEPASRRLAPGLAALMEAGERILRANYHRLGSPPIYDLPAVNDRWLTVLVVFMALIVLLASIAPLPWP